LQERFYQSIPFGEDGVYRDFGKNNDIDGKITFCLLELSRLYHSQKNVDKAASFYQIAKLNLAKGYQFMFNWYGRRMGFTETNN